MRKAWMIAGALALAGCTGAAKTDWAAVPAGVSVNPNDTSGLRKVGAEVLFFTPYRIIASNYHREGASLRYLWEGWKITDMEKLHHYLRERQVDVLLLCPDVNEVKNSALKDLQRGRNQPGWLTRLPLARKNAPTLYRVTP